ncbi:cAMP-dependent protein kinase regulator [Aureococcus anophagefferens]|nr:cAMP-dependent protein kinase regulator [Aureococcus anophagefferens]
MLSLCPCVRDDRAEVAQRAAELVKNPLPAMSGGADTRKFGDPVEGWLQRVVDGDECEAVWCCLRERHLLLREAAQEGRARKPLGYVDLREGARLRDGEKTVAKASGRGLESFRSATPDARPTRVGEVCLAGCSVARGTADDRKKVDPKRLCVTLPEGRYLKLAARNEADAEAWTGAICDSIAILAARCAAATRVARARDSPRKAAGLGIGEAPHHRRPLIYGADLEGNAPWPPRGARGVPVSPDGGDLDAELEQSSWTRSRPGREAGDVVVWQGDWGDAYYAVESGAVEILVDGSRPDRMAPITSGGGFGSSRSRRRARRRRVYAGGAVLIKEGEVGDAFYVVNVGVVEVTTKAGFRARSRRRGREKALLDDARTGKVKSSSASMLVLNKKQFLSIVGPARAVVENASGSSGG